MTDPTKIFPCPKGHQSTQADFCSECGTWMKPASGVAAPVGETCPECSTARVAGARYCEACRHDFRAGEPTVVAAPELCVAVLVDPSMVTEPDPDNPCPAGQAEQLFALVLDETLVGRLSDGVDGQAEIPIADSGISRRHLCFQRQEDGIFTVRDLNSTNGTWLNNVEIRAGVEWEITAGDELTIGEWTRLAIRAR